jgi:aminoglycoside phosphotransferase (APT) family kinase protein
VVPGRESVTLPAGALSRDEAVTRYRAATGADVENLDYYIVLNHWRSACIAHGVYARYVRGQKPADGVDIESFRRSVTARLDQAEAAATIL